MTVSAHPLCSEFALQAQRVSFGYRERLFEAINLELRAGSTLAIMGTSGSGKSTLLQLFAGILRPTTGNISVAGRRLDSLSNSQLSWLRLHKVGIIYQFGELLPELTLQENVELPLLFAGRRRRQSRLAAQELLDVVGLANERNRFVYQVSGGQLQRAAVARALVLEPAVVLADEPTGALDEETAEEVMRLLLNTAPARGAAVIIVTHADSLAQRCDNVARLVEGTLVKTL